MLYILPPPTNPSPPSVWDLIINFHQKGCQESETTVVDDSSSKAIKFSCKGQQLERKIRRSWCKTTTTPSSSPSSSTNHFNNVSERKDNEKEMKKAKVHSVVLC